MDKCLSLLGIARKAGLLAVGGDAVSTAAHSGKARLVISASDAAESATRRARMNAQAGGAEFIAVHYTKFELGNITGRGSPVTAAILDAGLAAGFAKELEKSRPGQYGDTAERLAENASAMAERKRHTPKRRTAL